MGILIFIITGITTMILLTAISKEDKNIIKNIIISVIVGIVLAGLGTYQGCADGWASTSIGKNGACSHHGGVDTFINIYGVVFIITSLIIILFSFIKNGKKN